VQRAPITRLDDDVVGLVASEVTIAPGDTFVTTASDTIATTTTNTATVEGDLQSSGALCEGSATVTVN
jgi:hypothetical protein